MDNNNDFASTNTDNVFTNLSVPYDDLEVLTTSSKELELVDYYFDSVCCHDKEIETLLYEVIGYSLAKTSKLNKAFIFKGNGRNGKSKIFRVLEALLETKQEFETKTFFQCSHEHLEKLSGSKAGSKSTVGALKECTVNIAEDQKQPKYINNSLITRLISGEPISIELKNKEQETFVPFATMLFSVNEVIDFKETGIFITDRFVVIPFNNTFTDDNNNRNINIEEELCKPLSLQIIATRAIEAFEKVLENGRFTIPDVVERETRNYFLECNNVAEFCSLYPIKTIIIKSLYYDEYCKWCKENNREKVTNSRFGKEVLAFGYRSERYSFANKRDTYYASPTFNNENTRDIYNEYLIKNGISLEAGAAYKEQDLVTIFGVIPFSEYLCNNLYNKTTKVENT